MVETVTGYTATRMKEIEDNTIVDAAIINGELILTRFDNTVINAGDVSQYTPEELAVHPALTGAFGSETSLTPIQFLKTDADIVVPAAQAGFSDLQTPGTVAAVKSWDLVLPASRGAQVGDWVAVELSTYSASTAAQVYIDAATINAAGAAVNRFEGNAAWGQMGWVAVASAASKISSRGYYQLQAGDFLANGDVRVRLQTYNAHATATRTLLASGLFPFKFRLLGPFG